MRATTHKRTDRISRDDRRNEAQHRQALRDSRTADEQIALLNKRLGEGHGATRERERLSKMSRRLRRANEKKGK